MRPVITRGEMAAAVSVLPRLSAFLGAGFKTYLPPGHARSALAGMALGLTLVAGAVHAREPIHPAVAADGFKVVDVATPFPVAERPMIRDWSRALDGDLAGRIAAAGRPGPRAASASRVSTAAPPAATMARPPVATARPAPAARESAVALTVPEVPPAIMRAVLRAGGRTGMDPAFLLAVAAVESRMDVGARNTKSSAAGPFQFTRVAWFEALYRFGAEQGLGAVAAHISQAPDGAMVVSPRARARILALRDDPGVASLMAAAAMKAACGQGATVADMYLEHVLGSFGASQFVAAARSGHAVRSDQVAPTAVRKNPGLFIRDGEVLSAAAAYASIRQLMEARHGAYRALLSEAAHSDEPVEVAYLPSPR